MVLVGLPGSGKSTVGPLVAEALGAPFVDVDALVVRRAQMPIARIFGEFGESRFREYEREAMAAVLAGEPAVVAPGGGWIAQPGNLDAARAVSYVVWLQCSLGAAVKRAAASDDRPLLAGDPATRMRALLAEREAFYRRADAEVRNELRTAAETAAEVARLARERAGW